MPNNPQLLADFIGPNVNNTVEEIERARITVCANAETPSEAKHFLSMLGLL